MPTKTPQVWVLFGLMFAKFQLNALTASDVERRSNTRTTFFDEEMYIDEDSAGMRIRLLAKPPAEHVGSFGCRTSFKHAYNIL